ncbi:MAG TPA: tRNA (adenosine(37)-N6)-threonylcarbamoyltransferase complex ATPase subunit type 1 TsaE [Phycisphaerae bacterium]
MPFPISDSGGESAGARPGERAGGRATRSARVSNDNEEQTRELGRRIGAALRGGEVLALIGPLGAGKTRLAKGIVEGAGAAVAEQVTSPTFVLMNEYVGRVRIHHIDAYRLRGPDELVDLGIEEMFRGGATVLLEWADRVPSVLPDERLTIDVRVAGPNLRMFHFAATGKQAIELIERAGMLGG